MKPELKDLISSLRAIKSEAEKGFNNELSQAPVDRVQRIQAWQLITSPSHIQVLLDRIEELEEQQKLWLEPTEEMAQAGLAEVQRTLDEWNDQFISIPQDVTDDMASDMAVFVLQAMAGAK